MWRLAFFAATLLAIIIVSMLFGAGAGYLSYNNMSGVMMVVISFVIAFALYDAIYVYVTRRYGEMDLADKLILFGLELTLASSLLLSAAFNNYVYVVPSINNEAYSFMFWVMITATLILPLRAFIGVSYVVSTRKIR